MKQLGFIWWHAHLKSYFWCEKEWRTWIKFVSILILVAAHQSFIQTNIFVMHKKIDAKQDNIERATRKHSMLFGSTQSFQNKVYDKPNKEAVKNWVCSASILFWYSYWFCFEWMEETCHQSSRSKKKKKLINGRKRAFAFVLWESGFLRKPYFSNM